MNVDELNHQCGMDAIFGEMSHQWGHTIYT